jgi:hypothetical protein
MCGYSGDAMFEDEPNQQTGVAWVLEIAKYFRVE